MAAIPDFHTHRMTTERPALVSLTVDDFSQESLFSLQFHPWEVKADFASLPEAFCQAAEKAAALGETGLDRLRGPDLSIQMKAFEAVMQLAQELQKPVVVHCVKCWSEVEQVHRKYPRVKMLIHGFTGSPERLTALRRAGFWLALGKRALTNPELMTFLTHDHWHNLGLESDDDPGGLKPIIASYRTLCGCTEEELAARTLPNLKTFLSAALSGTAPF